MNQREAISVCPSPAKWAGESHVGFCKSLLTKGKWILKVASDSEGAADERIWRVLCRPARPARGECAARFDRDFVHRVAGDAVRSDELHRHGAVCADEGVSLARCAGAQEWLAKPRHIQPCLPHARSEGVRDIVPTFHESLCGGRENKAATRRHRARRQGAQAWLRARQEPHAAGHGDGPGGADADGARQCLGTEQQRGRRCHATDRASAAQRLCGNGRRAALSSRHGQSDRRTRWRLCAGGEGEPGCSVAGRQGRDPRSGAQGQEIRHYHGRCTWAQGATYGRRRTRHRMAQKHDFPGLRAVARITSKRGTDNTVERYFLMSQNYRPKDVMRIVRAHWTIENGLHWPLDVVLDEDLARNRKDNAPANLAVLRRLTS